MAKHSKQDIEQKIEILEDKIDIVMKSIVISQPSPLVGGAPRSFSLYEWYLAIKQAGIPPAAHQAAAELAGIVPEQQTVGAEVI